MVELKNSTSEITLNTGAKIPALGLGTWRSLEGEAYKATLHAIKESGYLHIDGAAIYKNEEEVGKAIRDSGVSREKLFVTTKLWGTQHRNPEQALDQSLKRLGLDYVDLYLIHWPVAFKTDNIKDGNLLSIPEKPDGTRDIDLDGWSFIKSWELFQELPKTGKTKAVGVSNFSINNLKDLLNAPTTKVTPAVNQIEVHPLLPQTELIEFALSKGIITEAYSPLGSLDSPLFTNQTLLEVAKNYDVSVAQLLINWALKRGYVVLPKSVNPQRIDANFKTFQLKDEDFNKVSDLVKLEGEQRFVKPDWSPFKVFE
ncbi:hypothetical protein BN7_1691 [Wickerhamomyces ciferrii]|uniref:NADP-dependent oxidoreductase domain-containing protein n=1 Tax=Wickerhamomyces ciferrii (strain ATCC 14091 / BCRC 22168 / CBS 111 / JCM 3599 / NBRC 0793 / NRRL Y-1031 F-60-10) TaxID=1206466 RepID=K0KGP0_WICCF|nr:uncharacterized protein BN7_1691 [Wickerhamomyces ciferrii]CCH42146.1 hypothetical protein BN7_1691 [Wickerhamomyces ciferrii]